MRKMVADGVVRAVVGEALDMVVGVDIRSAVVGGDFFSTMLAFFLLCCWFRLRFRTGCEYA